MLALGVVIVSASDAFQGDLVAILFGQILGTTTEQLVLMGAAAVAVTVIAAVASRPFLLLSFDPEQADVAGFPSRRYHALMLLLVALTVVVAFEAVGTLLVFGMLLAPSATGALVAHRTGVDDGRRGRRRHDRDLSRAARELLVRRRGLGDDRPDRRHDLLRRPLRDVGARAAAGGCGHRPRDRRDARGSRTPMSATPGAMSAAPTREVGAAAVEARSLDIGYPGEVVVGGIDLVVQARSSLALVGTNGSGKSTLIRTIVGLLPPLAGSLTVFGAAPGRSPTRVAYAAQFHAGAHILPIRVTDVVRMARFAHLGLVGRMTSTDHDLVRWAMESMGVADLGRAPLRTLSGGQRQRVYLAQALARQADLIVLDEPTAGLDAGGRERYLDAFAASCIAAPRSSRPPTTSARRPSTTRCSCSHAGWSRSGAATSS